MEQKIEVTVYQHPTFDEGKILFQEDIESKLFEKCEYLHNKTMSEKDYPKEEVEKRFAQLLQTVSLEKTIVIKLKDNTLSWNNLMKMFTEYFPQMVWTLGKITEENGKVFSFQFIPLVINADGFPFGTILSQALLQQGVPNEEDPIEEWIREVHQLAEKCIISDGTEIPTDTVQLEVESTKAIETNEDVPVYTKEVLYTDNNDNPAINQQALQKENGLLRDERARLVEANQRLEEKIALLREHSATQPTKAQLTSNSTELNKQALYYEEALRREKDAKERMRLSKEKLEHLVSRLERQVMDNSLDILEGELPYVDRKDDWHAKRHIDLIEYDQLYQKAKYLEHTWQVNQRLIVISERMTMSQTEVKYERERVNQIKHSAKDIELFVMMDECRMINDRVKIKKGFLWLKPRVIILKGDYENLVEKAAYFDVIQSENQLLERIIEENEEYETKPRMPKKKVSEI